MKSVGHFLATLLAAVLSLTVFLWILGSTLASPSYLEHQATSTGLYSQLSVALPGTDPTVIQTQVEAILPQFISYLTAGGAAPTADFGAGQVSLGITDVHAVSALHLIRQIGLLAPIAAAVLVILIVILPGTRRLSSLARATLGSALSLAVSAGLLWVAPGFALQGLNTTDVLPIRSALTPFLTDIIHDLSTHLLVAAGVLVVITVLLKLIQGIFRVKTHFTQPPKPEKPPAPAGSPS